MKRMQITQTSDGLVARARVATTAATGTHCPFTGWWSATHADAAPVVYIWKGDVMPGYSGNPVEWQLDKSDPGARLLSDMHDRAHTVRPFQKTGVPG